MAAVLRFHLDESVSIAVAAGLRRRHIDLTTAAEAGLLGASDIEHIEFALRHSRVLVTHDADFLVLAGRGVSHAGIAYCHPKVRSIGEIIRALETMHTLLEPDEIMGRVQFI